jgi:hypothetical protein
MPLAAFAAPQSPQHAQDELANGQAQLADTQQQVSDMQAQADQSAANDRMIALLRSQAMRERQLNLIDNGNAMDQIANALAESLVAQGDASAQNDLMIAQNKAAQLISIADANLANAQMLAQTKGQHGMDELANAQAQSDFLHQVADFITGQQAQINMSNDHQIAQAEADAVQTQGEEVMANGEAMGADEVLAADDVLNAGEIDATSDELSVTDKADALLSHAESSLANDEEMVVEAGP